MADAASTDNKYSDVSRYCQVCYASIQNENKAKSIKLSQKQVAARSASAHHARRMVDARGSVSSTK